MPAASDFRLVGRRVAAHDVTVPVDQELGEIPLDRLRSEEAGRCLLQRLEQRMGVQAVDLGFGEHREGDAVVVGAELPDRPLVARLLMAELVARETQHSEAPVTKPPMQLFQPRILRREPAFAGDIDDEHRIAVEVGERRRPAVDGLEPNVGGERHAGLQTFFQAVAALPPWREAHDCRLLCRIECQQGRCAIEYFHSLLLCEKRGRR